MARREEREPAARLDRVYYKAGDEFGFVIVTGSQEYRTTFNRKAMGAQLRLLADLETLLELPDGRYRPDELRRER